MRADAQRNRVRLLEAATEAFAECGLEVSVAEIARRAGVGQGTVFRRFPTKADLVAAVLADRLTILADHAQAALEHADAWEGLREFMIEGAAMKAHDRGFFEEAAAGAALCDSGVRDCHQRLFGLVSRLLERAQAAGEVRADLVAEDVPPLMGAAVSAAEPLLGERPDLWRRYLDVMLAGMRPGASGALGVPPPTGAELAAEFDRRGGGR